MSRSTFLLAARLVKGLKAAAADLQDRKGKGNEHPVYLATPCVLWRCLQHEHRRASFSDVYYYPCLRCIKLSAWTCQ
jgi:hypothetical protein